MPDILIVEDKESLRTMLRKTLEVRDYGVVEAGDVYEARRLIQSARYAAVLTDLRLPAGSGFEVLQAEDPDKLYLLSLGPAGTLVAAWLSKLGRWAIDVGHISESWANVFAGGQWPEALDVVKK